jgi:hypothetical protein
MTETQFKSGEKVMYLKKMAIVPHPEGKTDRNGEVLPVFRDTWKEGVILSYSDHNNKYWLRPGNWESYKDAICGERYYDFQASAEDIKPI